jgi:UDP-3-O-[3-hydroxymyristoyl] N-acetylglucosamine deacetylase
MAAIAGSGIDNLIIEIDGPEVPILDGTSSAFLDAFEQAGFVHQAAKRRFIRVLKTSRIEAGASWAEFRPYEGTRYEVEIDFETPVIGRQKFASDMDAAIFRKEISRARTFGFMRDVEKLWAAGLALGSSLDNSLVIGDDNSVINPGGLRYKDEFVRHKTLDAIGDLALAGAPFIGCFRSYRGGHRLNAAALRALLSDHTAFEIVEMAGKRGQSRGASLVAVNAPFFAPWAI